MRRCGLFAAVLSGGVQLLLLCAVASAQGDSHSGFDVSQMDRTADPCVDFYQFSCGGWRAKNPIPPDKARINRYEEMKEASLQKLRILLETAAKPDAGESASDRQVGDYYAACMDESAVEKERTQPIRQYADEINKLADKRAMLRLMAELNASGMPTLFDLSASPDRHNSAISVAEVSQGGLSLPDRDYYLKTDKQTVEQRREFTNHITKTFVLAGDAETLSAEKAEKVLKIETLLAQASLDRTAQRDPANLDHKMTIAEFDKLAPNFVLTDFLVAAHAPQIDSLNVAMPDFFHNVSGVIETIPLDEWKVYLRWRVLNAMSPVLSADFVSESFRFNSQYLRGIKTIPERWKRCVTTVDQQLGEASGRMFVDKYFGAEGRQQVRQIVSNIMEQLAVSISSSNWMSDQTKEKALLKLKKINNSKIGFPDHYRDYSSIQIKRSDFAGNYARASRFEFTRQMAKIGKPVDKTEWDMTPPTVNAYYAPDLSEIVLPAGILQPPMFDLTADEAYSYGAIGRVIGHELTHGFDDEGRKYDAYGNLSDWWTGEDAAAFEKRAACIEAQYSEYSPVTDDSGKPLYLNGKLTLGENVADNGGLRIAYRAYMKAHEAQEPKAVDGFTPAQRVFLGYAISRCENVSPELSRMLIRVDPHSPGKFRLIGPIVNMPEFQEAYSCKTGQPMAPENRCTVW